MNDTIENSVQLIEKNLSLYFSYYQQLKKTLFIRYEDMMQNAPRHIRQIARYLGVVLDDNAVSIIEHNTNIETAKRIAASLETRNPGHVVLDRGDLVDPLTMIHDNHIHGGFCRRWEKESIKNHLSSLAEQCQQAE